MMNISHFCFTIYSFSGRTDQHNCMVSFKLKLWVSLSMSRRCIFGSSAIRVWARVSSLRSKLFPRSSPNPNECTLERSKSARTLIHASQRFRNKADDLHLMTPNYQWKSHFLYLLFFYTLYIHRLVILTLSTVSVVSTIFCTWLHNDYRIYSSISRMRV